MNGAVDFVAADAAATKVNIFIQARVEALDTGLKGACIAAEATAALIRGEGDTAAFVAHTRDGIGLEISVEIRAGGWPK